MKNLMNALCSTLLICSTIHCMQQDVSTSEQEVCKALIPQIGALLRQTLSAPSKPLTACTTAFECLMAYQHQPDYLLNVLEHLITTPNDPVTPQMQDPLTCVKLTPILCSLGQLKIISAMLAQIHTDAHPQLQTIMPNAFVANEVQKHKDNLAPTALKEMQEMKKGLAAHQKHMDTLTAIRSQLDASLIRSIVKEYHALWHTLTAAENLLQAHIKSQPSASGAA